MCYVACKERTHQWPHKCTFVLPKHQKRFSICLRALDHFACILTTHILQDTFQLVFSRRLFPDVKIKLCPLIRGLRGRRGGLIFSCSCRSIGPVLLQDGKDTITGGDRRRVEERNDIFRAMLCSLVNDGPGSSSQAIPGSTQTWVALELWNTVTHFCKEFLPHFDLFCGCYLLELTIAVSIAWRVTSTGDGDRAVTRDMTLEIDFSGEHLNRLKGKP